MWRYDDVRKCCFYLLEFLDFSEGEGMGGRCPVYLRFSLQRFSRTPKGNELVSPLTVTRGLHFLDEQEQNYEKD